MRQGNCMQLGCLDIVSFDGVQGWHVSSEEPSKVDLFVNDVFVQTILCDHYRQDLKDLKISKDGLSGFVFKIDLQLFDKVSVRCHITGQELSLSPKYICPEGFFPAAKITQYPSLNQTMPFFALLDWPEFNLAFNNLFFNLVFNSRGVLLGLVFSNEIDNIHSEKYVALIKENALAIKSQLASKSFLSELSINQASVLAVKKYQKKSIVLYQFKSGLPLSYSRKEACFTALDEILDMQLKLNSIKLEDLPKQHKDISFVGFNDYQNFMFKLFKTSLRPVFKGDLREALFLGNLFIKMSQSTKLFAHGDLHPSNVLQDQKGNITVLDWDHYAFYPLGYDWSYFLGSAYMSPDDFGIFDKVVTDYGLKLDLDKAKQRELQFNFWSLIYARLSISDASFYKSNIAKELKQRIEES